MRWLIVAALLGQLVFGLASEFPPRHEVFPFASWFLFVLVPNATTEYDVEFRAVDDQPLPAPVRFSRAGGWVNQPHSITLFNVIQDFGSALREGDAARALASRRQLEAFCRPGHLRYDVVRVTYDPLLRYDTGASLQRQVLGSFVTHEP